MKFIRGELYKLPIGVREIDIRTVDLFVNNLFQNYIEDQYTRFKVKLIETIPENFYLCKLFGVTGKHKNVQVVKWYVGKSINMYNILTTFYHEQGVTGYTCANLKALRGFYKTYGDIYTYKNLSHNLVNMRLVQQLITVINSLNPFIKDDLENSENMLYSILKITPSLHINTDVLLDDIFYSDYYNNESHINRLPGIISFDDLSFYLNRLLFKCNLSSSIINDEQQNYEILAPNKCNINILNRYIPIANLTSLTRQYEGRRNQVCLVNLDSVTQLNFLLNYTINSKVTNRILVSDNTRPHLSKITDIRSLIYHDLSDKALSIFREYEQSSLKKKNVNYSRIKYIGGYLDIDGELLSIPLILLGGCGLLSRSLHMCQQLIEKKTML